MGDSNHILRMFRLLRLLSLRPRKSAKQLAGLLGVSSRTVYRYFKVLESLNYDIDCDEKNRYFILMPWQSEHGLEVDEKALIAELLDQVAAGHPLCPSIKHKLNLQANALPSPSEVEQMRRHRLISLIREALRLGKCIKIIQYRSLNSGLRDRIVEALYLDEQYTYLTAFDPEAKGIRKFHLSRMENIEIADQPAKNRDVVSDIDAFGFGSGQWRDFALQLDTLACQLLIEEHPDTRTFITDDNGHYIYRHRVRSWIGLGRFVLGLPGHVKVLHPGDFKSYLLNRMAESEY